MSVHPATVPNYVAFFYGVVIGLLALVAWTILVCSTGVC